MRGRARSRHRVEADAADAAAAPAPRAEQARPRGRRQREERTSADSRAVAVPEPTRVGGAEKGEGGPARGLRVSQSVASSHTRPQLGGPASQGAHRPDRKGRSFEASVPEERAPPSPRPPRPPRAWQTPSPPGPVPGADGGRERWGGEGRSPRGPSSAASLGREERRPRGLGDGG